MANSSWITDYMSRYEEDLNTFRNSLKASQQPGRSDLISSLYSKGITGGGFQKGANELGRTYNENIASLNRKESDIQMQGQQGNQFLSQMNQLSSLQAQYQTAVQKATQLRRGAEDSLYNPGEGDEATKWENQAKTLHGQITNLYGQLQGMDVSNPFVGQQVANMAGKGGEFETAANTAESQISSGKTIWNTVTPLLEGLLLPGLGGMLGNVGGAMAASNIPGLMQAGQAVSSAGGGFDAISNALNEFQQGIGAKLGIGDAPLSNARMQSAMGASPEDIMKNMAKTAVENKIQEAQTAKWGNPTSVKVDSKTGDVTTEFTPGGNIKDIPKVSAKTTSRTIGVDDIIRTQNIDPKNPNVEPDTTDNKKGTWIKVERNGYPVWGLVKSDLAVKAGSAISQEQFMQVQQDAMKMGKPLKEGTDADLTSGKAFKAPNGKTYITPPKVPTGEEINRSMTAQDNKVIADNQVAIATMGQAAVSGQKTMAIDGKEINVPTYDEAKNHILTQKYNPKVTRTLLYYAAQSYGKQDEAAQQLAALAALIEKSK